MDYSGKIITKNPVEPSQTSAPGVWTLDQATQAVQGNNWPIAYVPNPISRSLRFNSADSAYLSRTPGSSGNKKTFTVSFWIKRSGLSATNAILDGDSSDGNRGEIYFDSSDKLAIYDFYAASGGLQISSARVFRDVGAWMHIVIAFDTTQATDSNRLKIYVNGVQEDLASYSVGSGASRYPALNADFSWNGTATHWIGHCNSGSSAYSNQYLTEFYNVDGQQLDASYFGMTDPRTGAWIPKKYSGTYGTNGFYLNFSDNSTTAALGTDYSGNSNTWTVNNFSITPGSGNDSMIDVPTPWIPYNTTGDIGGVVRGNYATLNPLDKNGGSTVDGNLNFTNGAATSYMAGSTMVPTMPIYAEFQPTGWGNGNIEVGLRTSVGATNSFVSDSGGVSYNFRYGTVIYNGSTQGTYTTATGTSSVVMMAYDPSSGKLWFGLNGTWFNSGNPAAGTGQVYTITTPTSAWRVFVQAWDTTNAVCANFGQRTFAYTPPAGFKSLCTTNLPEPTVLNGSQYFNTVIWTGTNTTGNRSISGVGFQPDFVWAKTRSTSYSHALYDSLRGAGANKELISNDTLAEGGGNNDVYGYLSSFDSDGFSSSTGSSGNNWYFNQLNYTYVAWNWKANGAGVSVAAGDSNYGSPSLASTLSVNTTAGFSISTYTGNNTSGATVAHGLGVQPYMVICKNRTTGIGSGAWPVWHKSLAGGNYYLFLNTTAAQANGNNNFTSAPTNYLVNLGTSDTNNTADMVMYCFAPVAGYSAFGSYTGNGSTDGPFVYTGFRVRWLLVKETTPNARNWMIFDAVRSPYNQVGLHIMPNSSDAEGTGSGIYNQLDFLSNGIKFRAGTNSEPTNESGATYIYAAFAENPFKYSNAR